MEFENVLPSEIEKRSFEIIESELPYDIEKTIKPIVKRVIHTTADFDYLDNLCFSENVVEIIKNAIKNGADIVTDTQMARSGINKKRLALYGGEVHCFMSDEDVAKAAKENGTTRAVASMEKASKLEKDVIFAVRTGCEFGGCASVMHCVRSACSLMILKRFYFSIYKMRILTYNTYEQMFIC